MAQKPSIPKGTRDFGPAEMARRNYIFDTIRSVYALYGFQQIETPAMENLSTLMGKYGEEGDKLLFKILNSGDFLKPLANSPRGGENLLSSLLEANGNDALSQTGRGALAAQLCEKGLRYDLTVPFARYVVQHREELTMPFRRYQVQPVWRADRPQKGRYREFYQFDGDVVGSDSLLNEVELMQIIDEVFRRFGIRVGIKINNRKILTGIAEIIGQADKIVDITVAIDKLDKIGLDNVNAELAEAGIPAEAIERLQPIIKLSGTNEEKLATMRAFFGANPAQAEGEGADHPAAASQASETDLKASETDLKASEIGLKASETELKASETDLKASGTDPKASGTDLKASEIGLKASGTGLTVSEIGLKGCDEVEFVLSALRSVVGGLSADIELDLTLARGLNYYTGCIFEVKALDVEIGSITGGGRYDNLTGIFGMPGLSGVGISFGIDRIFDVLNALDAYPTAITTATQLLFVNFGEAEAAYALPAVAAARRAGIRTEIFPDAAKMKKQMQYANARAIPFVALAGETEMAAETFTLKNMTTGEQSTVTTDQLIAAVQA